MPVRRVGGGVLQLYQILQHDVQLPRSDAGVTCGNQIATNVFDGKKPECSCLAKHCEMQPQASRNQACVQRAFDTCWQYDKVGCTNDDDNNDLCVWYCMQWFINDGYNCEPEERHTWTPCETECHKYIKDPSSEDYDGTLYAQCAYECASNAVSELQ